MTPETAVAKAMWVIANSHDNAEAVSMMERNIANEISSTSPINRRTLNFEED
jgi:hypothetical protein